ncbi:MAG: type II toxin-antitoxin system death-on-curing family toxin [Clostridia bacterium]|nr:type II toxin-antitoxin system death-on-curing family toxin [Clostridia bacterium]
MIKFDRDKVLLLQQLIIESSGGTAGIRDFSLLDSALNACFQTFGNVELYPSKEEKGARLGFNLVSNHAFVDGNKRIGVLVMLSFLELNGIKLHFTDEELISVGLSLADGSMKYDGLLSWINAHKEN